MLDATRKQNERWGAIGLLVRTSHWHFSHWHFSFVLHKNVSCTCSPHTLRWFKENSCKDNGYMEGRLLQGRTGKKVAASWNCSVLEQWLMDLAGFSTKKNIWWSRKIGIIENFPIYTDEHTSDSLLHEHAFSTGLKWFTPFLLCEQLWKHLDSRMILRTCWLSRKVGTNHQ